MLEAGVLCFGLVIGYVTYRTLVRSTANAAVSDLATVIGAVGGGVVTGLVEPGTATFGWYGVGLAAGFAGYALLYRLAAGSTEFARTMGRREVAGQDPGPSTDPRAGHPPGGGPV